MSTRKCKNRNEKVYGVLTNIAPEVLRGKEYTQASDIYAFGIIVYEVYRIASLS